MGSQGSREMAPGDEIQNREILLAAYQTRESALLSRARGERSLPRV
jgi:hypothetical protein